jgi:hypothetical protein
MSIDAMVASACPTDKPKTLERRVHFFRGDLSGIPPHGFNAFVTSRHLLVTISLAISICKAGMD